MRVHHDYFISKDKDTKRTYLFQKTKTNLKIIE
ncbi:Integrase protein family protein (plasmid) [Borrelia crocidurae DOU]|uniref:Integrase protein family protein n=1 Tax=Borrelia crocidurae DOU TaxID=1293575 RepID=W5SSD9_9SPIR|nr:Integrase protein family protein [Borrelia crocidurae DOU]